MTKIDPALLPLGVDGVLVRFSDRLSEPANRAALAFRAALLAELPKGVTETATSLTSVFIRFRPDLTNRSALESTLAENLSRRDWLSEPLPEGRTIWRIPAVFGGRHGPQLEEAADLAGTDPVGAIEDICQTDLRVLAIGFAPGQPYLGFLEPHWDIPRQSSVTAEVQRGAVVVAVRQVIPFANAAPTGWRHIGRTAFRCYDRNRQPPLALAAGDALRFEPVSEAKFERLLDADDPMGGATGEVLK